LEIYHVQPEYEQLSRKEGPEVMITIPHKSLGGAICKVAALTLAISSVSITVADAQRPKPQTRMLAGDTLYTLLKPGQIPAIFDPEFVSAAKAESLYYAEEPMMVVRSDDEVKAYSIWHLDNHEVVNDHIGGAAIAVTW
jgi:Protein of unknown function (DUF3179)